MDSEKRVMFFKQPFLLKNFLICLAVAFGNVTYGYQAAILGTTLSQPTFLKYFGLKDAHGVSTANSAALIGAMSGVFQAGSIFGIFTTGMVLTRYGCKMAILYSASICLVGVVLVAASQNIGMFIGFRFVTGIGSGLLQVCPVHSSELSPPDWRGFFVGMNGLMIALGFGLASWVGLAFNSLVSPGDAQWRGPIGVGILFCLIILVLLIFIPESPRWKIMNGQLDEAWTIIRAIHQNPHNNNNDQSQDFARCEFEQICKQIELDRTLDSSWLQMFRKPSYRRRSLLAMSYAFLGESTAMLVITNYGSILYKQLGYDSHDQIVLEAAYQVVPFVGNLVGSLIVDKVGRRPLMLAGLIGCCTFVSIETAMVASFVDGPKNPAGLRMGVAALFCFIFCYAIGVDVAGIVFYGEIFPNHIRAKGLTLAVSSRTLADLIYLESATSAFANIGWRFFLVFISVMVVGIIVMYFVLPETRGLPLEEVAALFGDEDEVRSHMSQINAGISDESCLTSKGNGDWVDSQKPFACLHLEYAGA